MTLAPAPVYQEKDRSANYELKYADNPTRRGPLRFEEGLATDTDIPNSFTTGVMQGYMTSPGRPNHNANVWIKTPQETMAERAHVGSAAWVEAPTFLSEFSQGSFADSPEYDYPQVNRSGGRYSRWNAATVTD